MTDTPASGPDACSGCGIALMALEAKGRVLYTCDRCGVDVCSDCSASTKRDGVVCEACATPEEWRRG